MHSRNNSSHETSFFRGRELAWRDTRFTSIFNISILTVGIGIMNVVLFSDLTPTTARRYMFNCDILKIYNVSQVNSFLWASTGIFTILAFIVAPIGMSTIHAWSGPTTTFIVLGPIATLVCLCVGIGSTMLGICTISFFSPEISKGSDVSKYPKIFYCIMDFSVAIFGAALFFLLLSLWVDTLDKRLKSKAPKDEECGERRESCCETGGCETGGCETGDCGTGDCGTGDCGMETVINNSPTVYLPNMSSQNVLTRNTTTTPAIQAVTPTPAIQPAPAPVSPTTTALVPSTYAIPGACCIQQPARQLYNTPQFSYPSFYPSFYPAYGQRFFSPPPPRRLNPYYPFRSGYALRRNPRSGYPMYRFPY